VARSVLIFFAMVSFVCAHTQALPTHLEKNVKAAGELYFSNRTEGYEKSRVLKVQAILRDLIATYPENAMLYSLMGRTYFLIASNSISPVSRYKNLNTAISYWGKSYALAQDDFWIRYNCYKDISGLPTILGYSEWVLRDTLFLYSKCFGKLQYKTDFWLTWRWFHTSLLPHEKNDPQEIPILAKQMALYQIGWYYYRTKNYDVAKSFMLITNKINPYGNYGSGARLFIRDYLW